MPIQYLGDVPILLYPDPSDSAMLWRHLNLWVWMEVTLRSKSSRKEPIEPLDFYNYVAVFQIKIDLLRPVQINFNLSQVRRMRTPFECLQITPRMAIACDLKTINCID